MKFGDNCINPIFSSKSIRKPHFHLAAKVIHLIDMNNKFNVTILDATGLVEKSWNAVSLEIIKNCLKAYRVIIFRFLRQ